MNMIYADQSYRTINRQTGNGMVVVLPLGATEQHGPHLAVSTDTSLVSRVAIQAERLRPDKILLCPALPFGASHHHLHFGGTLSLSGTVYTRVIAELTESLLKNGFRKVVLLNGHGGNITPVRQALTILSGKFDAIQKNYIALATYWELAAEIFNGAPPMESPALSHACEYETSMLLHLFPEKVFMSEVERAIRPAGNGYIPFEDDEPYRGVSISKATQFISGNGCSGEPQLATGAKGKHLFEHAVESFVRFIDAFSDWPFLEDLNR